MPDYTLRYRLLDTPMPDTPRSAQLAAADQQAAIETLKSHHPGERLRIDTIRRTTPEPPKRKSGRQWIALALVLVFGAVNLAHRLMN